MLRALLAFLSVQFIQSRLLRIALLPPRELQEGSANRSAGVDCLHRYNANASSVVVEHIVSTTKNVWSENQQALVQWSLFNIQAQQRTLRFKEISQLAALSSAAVPLFSRSIAAKLAPSVTTPSTGSLSIFRVNTDLKLLEAPSSVASRALIVVGNRAVQNWTNHPVRARSRPWSKARLLQDLTRSLVHFVSQPPQRSRGSTCSAMRDQPMSKQQQPKRRSSRSRTGGEEFSYSAMGCTRWLCSCVSFVTKSPKGFPVLSPTDSCGSNEGNSQALTMPSLPKASVLHHQHKAAARMYKQARQLLMMKQAVKKDSKVTVHQLSTDFKHVLKVRDEHVLKFREDASGEYCNLLVAIVTLVILLAMSQQTRKLPQDPAATWSGTVQFLPALTIPPTLSEDCPAAQLLESDSKVELLDKQIPEPAKSCDVPPESEMSSDLAVSQDSNRFLIDANAAALHSGHESNTALAGVQTGGPTGSLLPTVSQEQEPAPAVELAAELPELETSCDVPPEPEKSSDVLGDCDDKDASEKFDDQDEVSSCVSSCGTSDGYEKLEIGGGIFMDEDEDANSESCT